MTFPPAPAANIDWTKLGLAVTDMVNGHVESTYSVTTGEWTSPKFVEDPYLRIHGLAPALNYGQQVYEGLKAYRSATDQILLFRPRFHAARMQHSAEVVSIPAVPTDHFLECVNLAVARNAEWVPPHASGAALYVRPVLLGSAAHFALTPPAEFTFCVYVQPFSTYHGIAPLPAVVLEDFDRAAPRGTGHAKIGGNYAPVMKWSEKAKKEGFPMTLHLDSATHSEIDEFSTSGFLGAKMDGDKPVLVVPKSDNIIGSVTSDSCMQIARSLGWTVGLRSVASKWVTWYQNIRRTDDTEIRKWYIATYGNNDEKVFGNMSDPAVLKMSRDALYKDVLAEKSRSFFSKPTTDTLVRELARDWDSTNFLLDWYCRYADVPRPIPFSSSWNIQTKVGLDVLRNSQKGIRLHNAFIHWRQSSKEIGCGILYFIIALLDKWVELLSGGQLVGLSTSLSDANRMAVGFGLAYYLIGAVLIDTSRLSAGVKTAGRYASYRWVI